MSRKSSLPQDAKSVSVALTPDNRYQGGQAVRGGPYARKMLVIWTDRFMLGRESVERFLAGQRFQAGVFDNVVLGLDYHSAHQCVAYRLDLGRV